MRIQSKIVVGYELGNNTSQMSYSYLTEEEPITLPCETGRGTVNIPTQLCKRIAINQWFFGMEAKRMEGNKDVITVNHLLEQALTGAVVNVDGSSYQAKDLLVVFMQKSIDAIRSVASFDQIQLFVIIVDELNERTIQLLDQIVEELPIRKHSIMYQTREEAFFHYLVRKPNLCNDQALLVDGSEQHLRIFRLEMNKIASPTIAFIEKKEYSFIATSGMTQREKEFQYDTKKQDNELLTVLQNVLNQFSITSIFFLGDFFLGEWFQDTLEYLGGFYRIFIGNNLFSKGSCYGARNLVKGNPIEEQYIFLGNDKLKSDISIQAMENGVSNIKKLLEAGSNWYEASCNMDFIMEQEQELSFIIELYKSKETRVVSMKLVGMPNRPPKATRIQVRIRLISEVLAEIQVEDLGFGNLYPSIKQTWSKEIELE